MDVTREDASGTPLLPDRNIETSIDMDSTVTPVSEDLEELGNRSGFTKKKLSLARKASLKPITLPQTTVQTRNSHLFTSQAANSPLRQFSLGQQGLGSADLQHLHKSTIVIRVFLPHLFKDEEDDNEATCVKVEVSRLGTAEDILNQIADSFQIDNRLANEAFAIWMISPLLELQLKPHHQPLELSKNWKNLLAKFAADAAPTEIQADKPLLYIKRRVQLTLEREMQLSYNPSLLHLLFSDAKYNMFADRYYMSSSDAAILAGIGFAIENNTADMTIDYIRKNLEGQVPDHLVDCIRGPMVFGKTLSSGRDLETVFSTWRENRDKNKDDLKRMFLEKLHTCCQQYGSAFFHGFIERPSVSPLKNLKRFFQVVAAGDADMAVTVGINRDTISVIDAEKHEIILMVPIEDCIWKKVTWEGSAASEDIEGGSNDTQPMLLLHFPEVDRHEKKSKENGPRTNVLQIFGFQTILIHSMLGNMMELHKRDVISEPNSANSSSSSENNRIVNRTPSMSKADRMCLATFVNGQCIKASGSLKKIVKTMQPVH